MTTTGGAKRTAASSKTVSAVNPVTDSLLQQILEELQSIQKELLYMNAERRAQQKYRQRQFQMFTEQPKTFSVEDSDD